MVLSSSLPLGAVAAAQAASPRSIQTQPAPNFAAVLKTQQTQTPPTAADEKERPASTSKASEDFRAWMAKSPAEKMRQAILHRMGLTEEELEALPPEERAKIEEQIAKEIQQEIEREASLYRKYLDKLESLSGLLA